MEKITKLISHLTFILSICFITLWILDYYNPLMNLLNNQITGKLLLVLFASAMYLAVTQFLSQKEEGKNEFRNKLS